MHGGSGLTDAEYRECIKHGVAKIDYYSYADKASFEAVQQDFNNLISVLYDIK